MKNKTQNMVKTGVKDNLSTEESNPSLELNKIETMHLIALVSDELAKIYNTKPVEEIEAKLQLKRATRMNSVLDRLMSINKDFEEVSK